MHAERDHLVRVVFPELRERLEKYRIHLVDIDLRWGVTAEQADNDMVLDLCLDQIDRCRPFFVGILGQRYGWVPAELPDLDEARFGWVQGMTGKSITELEILHGVLHNPSMEGHALFLFRKDDYLADVPEDLAREVYTDEHGAKLATVKDEIRAYCAEHDAPLREYPCRWEADRITDLELFGRWVGQDLWAAIKAEHDLPDAPPTEAEDVDPLVTEADYHERFMESRLRVYVGREEIQQELLRFAEGDDRTPCLVVGPSGSGKSAVLARFATTCAETHPDALVIPHFIGASPASTDLRQTLRRFCLILQQEFQFTDTTEREGGGSETAAAEVPQTVGELIPRLRDFIERIPAERRVVLVLDALNQFDETDNAQSMYWLPWELPSHVKIVASCIEDPDKTEPVLAAFAHRPHERLDVQPLTDDERLEIVSQVPSLSAKTLDDEQVALLLSNPTTSNPLFLLVALEELRGFGSFEQLNARIESFPRGDDALSAMFAQVIERLEKDFGRELVRSVLVSLACARRGLSDRELLDLVEEVGRGIADSTSDLFPVLRQLRPHLQHRGELHDFFHRHLFKAVQARYLGQDDAKCAGHVRLAEYFDAQDYWAEDLEAQRARAKRLPPTPRPANVRKVDELPFQRLQARQWDDLADLLTNWQFLEAKAEAQA